MEKINHIIFLMMENRSFDHYLGALNFDPAWRGTPLEGLASPDVHDNKSAIDEVALKPIQIRKGQAAHQTLRDPPHEWPEVMRAYNGGLMDGFVRAYQEFYPERGRDRGYPPNDEAQQIMGYHTRETLPVLYALADQFAVCDHWFASLAGSTWPNRIFALAGSCGNMYMTGDLRRFGAYQYPQPAVRRWNIPWKAYTARPGQMSIFDLWTGPVYHSSNGGTLDDFAKDCQARRLPALSIVEPDYGLDDDHWPHDPMRGQLFMARLVRMLMASPSWDDSLLIITYDEHGGFFDHVQPPRAPEQTQEQRLFLLGLRVPTLVVSAYTRAKTVITARFDHTSFLKTVAERWSLAPASERAAHAGTNSLWKTAAFDFAAGPRPAAQILPALDAAAASLTGTQERKDRGQEVADEPVTDLEDAFRQLAKLRALERVG